MRVWELIERLERLPKDAQVEFEKGPLERVFTSGSGSVVLAGYEDEAALEFNDCTFLGYDEPAEMA